MATDDKQPGSGAQPDDAGTDAGTDAKKPKEFIDRDDDQSPVHVDSDYEPDFPGEPGAGDETPDPGYIAFADELGDPLAGWPEPDTRAEVLPARRRSDDVDADGWLHRGTEQEQAGAYSERRRAPESGTGTTHRQSYPRDSYAGFGAGGDEADDMAAPIDGDTLFSDGDELEETGSEDSIDRDSTTAPATGDTPFTARAPASGAVTGRPPDSRSAAFSSPPIEPEANPESTGLPVTPAPAEDDVPLPPGETDDGEERNRPEALEAQEDDVEDFDDEFVDDFLNDLDAPEDSEDDLLDAAPLDDIGNREDALATGSPDPMQNLATAAVDTGATSMARKADSEAAMTRQPESKETERSLPVGMIAVVIIALALLAVGGYGVIQQRSELQAEIRDLQSRLATAPSAEEAAAERERQRQLALENESLGAEIEALAAENGALAEQLASLEDQLAQRAAEARAAEAAEAEARRAAEAAAQAAAARAATPATPAAAPAGPWFVNFGSYAERNVADRWAGKLKVDSGNVIVQTATASGKTLYRVRVVGLASQDAAERVATALEREYRLPRLWVGRN